MLSCSTMRRRVILFGRSLYFLVVLFTVQACSQSRFGEDLAASFDKPSDRKSVKQVSNSLDSRSDIPVNNQKPNKIIERLVQEPRSFPEKKKEAPIASIPSTPHPYRITIKLSKADPAAPAEAVTKALRMAGVSFEVEMIELVNTSSSSNSLPSSGRSRP